MATVAQFVSLGSILIGLLAGCAAPGEPIARQPLVAQRINDVAAKQAGNAVILTFTLPKDTTQENPLSQTPEIKIYREFLPAALVGASSPAQPPAPGQLIFTVTAQTEAQYRDGNRLRILTPLAPADISTYAGENAVYMVRTRISSRDSADSNLAEALILPAPPPIEDLKAQVTESAIELSWTTPPSPVAGKLGAPAIRYRVYRAQDAFSGTAPAAAANAQPSSNAPAFVLLGETLSPSFSDANFTFGTTYEYTVRSVAHYDAGEVESEAPAPLIVTPRDTFPPAAPVGLIAAVIPAGGNEGPRVDLSWEISPETDVTGYNVYRSEEEGVHGNRVNSSPLLTPAFRDISVVAGHQYFYRVTAVDRSGNESAPSAAVAVTLPGANEQENK
ncbi:MAG TPA: hypothetical protein VJN21_02080 [Candidatus Acidoferrales bacterium]|nr:hypothetical protein [Candidatus Acidoferrales bacterium]